MAKVRVNNHMKRLYILQRKSSDSRALAFGRGAEADALRVSIPPGEWRDCDFWDEVKEHKHIQALLEDGLISIGEDRLDEGGTYDFTSAGTTLNPPKILDQNIDAEAAKADIALENLEYTKGEPVTAKRRTRRTKAQIEADAAASQNFEQN